MVQASFKLPIDVQLMVSNTDLLYARSTHTASTMFQRTPRFTSTVTLPYVTVLSADSVVDATGVVEEPDVVREESFG